MAKKSKKQQPGGTPATVALTAAGVPFTAVPSTPVTTNAPVPMPGVI